MIEATLTDQPVDQPIDQLTGQPTHHWTKETIYFEGDAFFTDLLISIHQAKETIEIETYIFNVDPLGERVEAALIQAAERGVCVRLLVDGIGSASWIDQNSRLLDRKNLSVRIYHPVFMMHQPGRSIFRALVELGLKRKSSPGNHKLLSKLNKRNHRKLCVVDQSTAWVGSMNVSADHCISILGATAWRDTAVQLRGEATKELQAAFQHAWVRSHMVTGKRLWREVLMEKSFPKRLRSPLVRLNYTANLRKQSRTEFIARIKTAKKRIWITNPYLAPSRSVTRQLQLAARRGVDVQILVPRQSDVFFMPWVARAHYGQLLKKQVRIFEYLPRFLHAKSVLIDDWALVGTSNMNRRSLVNDLEVDVRLTKDSSLQELEWQFQRDLSRSAQIKKAPGGLQAFMGRIIIWAFKNWI